MKGQIPILLLSDHPQTRSGLARITRGLAAVLASMPEFRVGTLGRGGCGSRQIPWMQYSFPTAGNWGEEYLAQVWEDFTGRGDKAGAKGIVMAIYDPSRLVWLGLPEYCRAQDTKEMLVAGRVRKWGYFPIDAHGPGKRLSSLQTAVARGFDRVLGYGAWGATVLGSSLGREIDHIPHGVDLKRFVPASQQAGRAIFGVAEGRTLLGCVMTNQARKDWGLAFGVVKGLVDRGRDVVLWAKVDESDQYWSLHGLIDDYGLGGRVVMDIGVGDNDASMAVKYAACDLTMLPSLGEGFGFPVVESLACGVGCVTGAYGGATELVPSNEFLVQPRMYRVDGLCASVRPVYDPSDWVTTIEKALDSQPDPVAMRESVVHLGWDRLAEVWKKWFREGVRE